MALYLVQHGRSLPKTEDPDPGLSPEGKRETERIAGVAAGYSVNVSAIVHSGKKRARETATILSSALSPAGGVQAQSGMNPMDDVRFFSEQLRLDQDIMLVGHLPFLDRLIGLMITGNPDNLVFKLQNSGILCLDRAPDVIHPVIRWALMPAIG